MEAKTSNRYSPGVLASVLWLAAAVPAMAQNSFQVLHSFGGPGDGVGPSSGVVFDKQGNAYGETLTGGNASCADGCGLVYQLSAQKNGGWVESILYEFTGGADGEEPTGGLAVDAAGNLYGVTRFGGTNAEGTAFELTPGASGWTETILHSFCTLPGDVDGCEPNSGPILDSADNVYGTTFNGGSTGWGTIYQLSPSPSGWTETVLYTLCSQPNCADGGLPGALIRDSAGNLYGPAYEGGSSFGWCPLGCGVVFALRPQPSGQWQQQVLYSFQGGADGESPNGVALHGGALYGTTENGGGSKLCTVGCGTVFEVAAGKGGSPPTETILHRSGPLADGTIPASLAFDHNGNAYGLTGFGGCCGLIFEMTPGGSGKPPVYQVAHQFEGQDGAAPVAVSTHGNNVFGTTLSGGQYGVGIVFEITPASDAAK
jgi:uncharacterized repeat protein (TIGR03803 family)